MNTSPSLDDVGQEEGELPEKTPLLAVLIDADNISASHADVIFDEIAKHGEASVRRIYGDFAGGSPQGWDKATLARHAILPNQSFANVAGKNASDIALVIDAMDLLHSGRFDGFVIVSSDSDFTRLAARIREHGILAIGIGEEKTPQPLRNAYKRFVTVENLSPTSAKPGTEHSRSKGDINQAYQRVKNVLDNIADEDGWAGLGALGQQLNLRYPDFDVRSYGHAQLSALIKAIGRLEIKGTGKNIRVRLKPGEA